MQAIGSSPSKLLLKCFQRLKMSLFLLCYLLFTALCAKSLSVCKEHRVEDPDNDDEAGAQRNPRKHPDGLDHDGRLWFFQVLFQFTGGNQCGILPRFVALQFSQRHMAGENGGVHGKLLRPKMGVEKMHGEDEARSQQGLIAVDDGGHVDERAWQKPGEEDREPKRQPGGADDHNPPKHGKVIELLPVGPTPVLGSRSPAEEPLYSAYKLLSVALGAQQRVWSEENCFPSGLVAALLLKQSDHVCGESAEHDNGRKAVDISRSLEPAQQTREPRRPGSIGELQGKSGDRQGKEADDHAGVQHTIEVGEADELAPVNYPDYFRPNFGDRRLVCRYCSRIVVHRRCELRFTVGHRRHPSLRKLSCQSAFRLPLLPLPPRAVRAASARHAGTTAGCGCRSR